MRWQADFSDPESIKRFPWWLFLLLGVGVGGVFFFVGVGLIYSDCVKRTTWIDVQAEVIDSEVIKYEDGEGNDLYKVDVDYRYEVNGEFYENDFQTSGSSVKSWAEKAQAKFPAGSTVPVKVNPLNPEQSMRPGEDMWLALIFTLLGGILGVVFGWVGVYGIKKQRALRLGGSSSNE